MASLAQTVDGSLHTTGGAWQVTDAQITCDRSRAPQIEATVRLVGAPQAVRDAILAGDECVFVIESRSYHGGTLAELAETWAGHALGDLKFADVPTTQEPYGTLYAAVNARAWRAGKVRLWPAEGTRWDRVTRTLELRLTSIEGVLQRLVCLDESGWLPNGTRTSTDRQQTLEGIVRQLTSHLGVPVPCTTDWKLSPSTGKDRAYYDWEAGSSIPPPWEFGQTAWEYIDDLRVRCDVSHFTDPLSGDLWFTTTKPSADIARTPDAPIEWATDQAPLDAEGGYADAIAATFHWQEWDAVEGEVVDRQQTMVVLADGLTRWQDARAAVAVDYAMRPNRGYVERDLRLRNLTRYLTTTVESFAAELRNPETRNPFAYWFEVNTAWTRQSVQLTFPDATATVTSRESSILP